MKEVMSKIVLEFAIETQHWDMHRDRRFLGLRHGQTPSRPPFGMWFLMRLAAMPKGGRARSGLKNCLSRCVSS